MMHEAPERIPEVHELGRVHLVGIGGGGMSGLARLLRARGLEVTGSDARASVTLTALQALGVDCYVGHAAAQLGDADTVVVSSAIREDNPELAEARRRGLTVLPRTVALVATMRGYRGVGVAGTHGKTTTTSMLTVALQHCGLDPSFAVGGNLVNAGTNAHLGTGDVFVAETDESDGSFVVFSPRVAVVTNIDFDHVDQHGDSATYATAFDRFAERVEPGGALVVCADDEGSASLGRRAAERGTRVVTYGAHPTANVRIEQLTPLRFGSRMRLVLDGRRMPEIVLRVPGRHNAVNAAGALAAGLELDVSALELSDGLAEFRGTRRRFEFRGEAAGVRVFDDYAHHPTELRETLLTARQIAGDGRVVAVFQPHLFTRTQAFAADFAQSLGLADVAVVMDVFAAREDPIPGVTGALISDAVPLPGSAVRFVRSWSDTPSVAASQAQRGDIVLTVGAGDVTLVGPEVLGILRQRRG